MISEIYLTSIIIFIFDIHFGNFTLFVYLLIFTLFFLMFTYLYTLLSIY